MMDIIIVNYNSTDHLMGCLESVEQYVHGLPVTITVQDNASQDGIERIQRRYPKIRLSRNSTNLGFAKAVNQALKQTSEPFVMLLNPDTRITEGAFHTLLNFMQTHPHVGIAGPRILNLDQTVQASARTFPTLLNAFFGRTSLLSRMFPRHRMTLKSLVSLSSNGVTPKEVDWVSGACMMIRRQAIEDVGLLDERFFMYWEDADWCRRMYAAGWTVSYVPNAVVYHDGGASSKTVFFTSALEFHKSIYRLFSKYLPHSLNWLNLMIFSGVVIRLGIIIGGYLLKDMLKRHRV